MSYRPLPDNLTIKNSEIEGLGLFATQDIKTGVELGVTHYPEHFSNDGYIRTPLGGFYNHSDDPNCESVTIFTGHRVLKTIRDIKAGEEITSFYSLYSIK